MKKILRMFCCIALTMLAAGVSANAQWVQSGDDTIALTYEFGSQYAQKIVTVDVFAGDKTAEDLLAAQPGEMLDIIVTRTQGVTDSEGNYSYSFRNAGSSGKYVAYVSVEGMTDYITEEISFVNVAQFKQAVRNLNAAIAALSETAPDYQPVYEVIKQNRESFELNREEYKDFDAISGTGIAKILVSLAENGAFDENNKETVVNMVKKAVFVQKLNESKITDIFSDVTLSELNTGTLAAWYNKDFITEELQKDMTQRLSNRGFESYSAYKSAIVESYVLAAVRYPNGYKNVETVVRAFCSEIGLNLPGSISDNVWINLAGGNFASYTELGTKLQQLMAVPNTNNNNVNTGGGGGGGGGGVTSIKSDKVTEIVATPVPQPLENTIFADLSSEHWAAEAITALAGKGIVNGRNNNMFEPEGLITREEFVKLIVSCVNAQTSEIEINFKDVSADAWYYEYIKKAYSSGIVSGKSEEIFGVGEYITRQDIATIAYRVFRKNNADIALQPSENVFSDDESISDYAKEGIYAMRELGIIAGMQNNEFQPEQSATRAQAAMIIYNLISK